MIQCTVRKPASRERKKFKRSARCSAATIRKLTTTFADLCNVTGSLSLRHRNAETQTFRFTSAYIVSSVFPPVTSLSLCSSLPRSLSITYHPFQCLPRTFLYGSVFFFFLSSIRFDVTTFSLSLKNRER